MYFYLEGVQKSSVLGELHTGTNQAEGGAHVDQIDQVEVVRHPEALHRVSKSSSGKERNDK